MYISVLALLLLAAPLGVAADLTGSWLAQTSANPRDPQYARVMLRAEGVKLTGSWNDSAIEGAITGDRVEFLVRSANTSVTGSFKGRLEDATLSGELSMVASAGVGGAGGAARGSGAGTVAWKLARAAQPPPGGPKTWDF